MNILLEAFSTRAWCIDRQGNVVDVRVHPFGALDDDAIEDAAWLLLHDAKYGISSLIKYIANQIYWDYGIDETWADEDIKDLVDDVISTIACLKGMNISTIIDLVCDKLSDMLLSEPIDVMPEKSVEELGMSIKEYLNSNWLRARFGSEYQNFTERAGAMYFRTSSTDGFNWYNVICKFLCDISSKYKVTEVTVERDVSSTGDRKVYIDHMPFNEFLLNKPIVMESVKDCGTIKENLYEHSFMHRNI